MLSLHRATNMTVVGQLRRTQMGTGLCKHTRDPARNESTAALQQETHRTGPKERAS